VKLKKQVLGEVEDRKDATRKQGKKRETRKHLSQKKTPTKNKLLLFAVIGEFPPECSSPGDWNK
tara:strand:+ start:650 stop:841 length:192 start_codon:yes stop_codon:yes gene_type:complete